MAENAQAALDALFACRTFEGFRDILAAHPFLLDPVIADSIARNTAAVTDPGIRNTVDRVLWILEKCREKGVDGWYEEMMARKDLEALIARKQSEPRDLGAALADSEADLPPAVVTLASMSVETYRGDDHAYSPALHDRIKAAGEDGYLKQLARLTTTESDWAEAVGKTAQLHRNGARKYVAELAGRYPDDPLIPGIGFAFTQERIPNAFALRVPDDGSVAIGVDAGLISLFANLFQAALVSLGRDGGRAFFVGLLTDMVKSYYLGLTVSGIEERLLGIVEASDIEQRHWGDWAGYIALRFLVGHEVGHIHLRHLDSHQAPRVAMMPGNGDSELTAFDHQTEFEADAWSARELLTALTTVSESIAARTLPAIFMSLMALIDDLHIPVDRIGKTQHDTHPPPAERAQKLLAIGREGLREGLRNPGMVEALWNLPGEMAAVRASREFQEAATWIRGAT